MKLVLLILTCELPGVDPNLEKASEVASTEVALESPQQQAPNVQMASIICSDVPVPEHFVPEHSVPEQLVPDHIELPPSLENVSKPDFMITSEDSDVEVEVSNSSFVLITSVLDQHLETNTHTATSTNDPEPSNLVIQSCAPAKTNVPSPLTLFLDSTILADVCESIYQKLNKLVQARNNLIHKDSYEKQWKRLKERVDFVLTELQRSCLDAQDSAQNKLQDWLKGVDNNLQEVKVPRTWVQTPLCLRGRNATDFIPTGIHSRELSFNWLSKLNVNPVSTELALLQRNAELESENKKLRKELLDQKLLLFEYKSSKEAKLEEARIREENILRGNEDFKREMKQHQEETNRMLKQMMEMFQRQAQP